MDEPCGSEHGNRAWIRTDELAAGQFGVVRRDQIPTTSASVWRAVGSGRLYQLSRGIYSTIAPALLSDDGWHAAALLAAGPGACLSHRSAAFRLKLTDVKPKQIEVSTPRDTQGMPDTIVHGRRKLERVVIDGLPTTTVGQTILDLAPLLAFNDLRWAMAEAEYHHSVQAADLRPLLTRGLTGSAQLRRAIESHMPKLAHCRSTLERTFLILCEGAGIALPEPNHKIGRSTLDMVWPRELIAIELHGVKGHTGNRRGSRDSKRALHARAAGYATTAYWYDQIVDEADVVIADLLRLGVPRAGAGT